MPSATPTIAEQLREAWEAIAKPERPTLEEILESVRKDSSKRRVTNPLDVDFTSLWRKLHGKQGLTVAEAEAIAKVLDVELDWSGVELRIA